MVSSGPEWSANGRWRLTTMQHEFSKSTGPTCDGGATCEPSCQTAIGGLTSFAEGRPVNQLHAPDSDLENATNDGCGPIPSASFATWDRDTSSWKTRQRSFHWLEGERLATYSDAWPIAGSMLSGTCCRREPLVCRTFGNDCLWLPTPTAKDGRGFWAISKHSAQRRFGKKAGSSASSLHWNHIVALLSDSDTTYADPDLAERLMGFPTGYSDLRGLATLSHRQCPNGSGAAS